MKDFDEVYSRTVRLHVTDSEIVVNLINNLVKNRSLAPFLSDLLKAYWYDTATRTAVTAYLEREQEQEIDSLLVRVGQSIKVLDGINISTADSKLKANRFLADNSTSESVQEENVISTLVQQVSELTRQMQVLTDTKAQVGFTSPLSVTTGDIVNSTINSVVSDSELDDIVTQTLVSIPVKIEVEPKNPLSQFIDDL